jgi:2-polyprenyl-3-methyl-5-hydroxy-6-metoxy-1,4-benzoquinol methylase
MEELNTCPLCSSKKLQNYLTCQDNTVTGEKFKIVTCVDCGFLFTNPRPNASSIGKYYESDTYVSHSDTNAGLINKLYHLIKKKAIKNKIALINNLNTKNKTLLDIGCGTGTFLAAAKDKGWKVNGIEPNDKARNLANKNYTLNVLPENELNNYSNNSFSIVSMWHVLEHVHQLKERVKDIHRLLETGGYAVIAVPNYTSWDAHHYKEFWAAYDVPRHLYHFSPVTIKKLFNEFELHHVKSFPMKFDSYYVAMLSEKYKHASLKYFRALYSGWISNLKTKNDTEKYSSVIYVFQKK